jgi:hypothetical protein
MVHLRLHNRDAAGRYSLGLAGIELVSHVEVDQQLELGPC